VKKDEEKIAGVQRYNNTSLYFADIGFSLFKDI